MALAAAVGQYHLPPPNLPCPTCRKPLVEKIYIIPCDRTVDHYFHFSCIKDYTDRGGDKGSNCPLCKNAITILHPSTRTKLPEDVNDECSICLDEMTPFFVNKPEFIVKAEDGTFQHEACYRKDDEEDEVPALDNEKPIPLLIGNNIGAQFVAGRVQKFAASAFNFSDIPVQAAPPQLPPHFQAHRPPAHAPIFQAAARQPVNAVAAPLFGPDCQECIEVFFGFLVISIVVASFFAFYYNLIVFDLTDPMLQILSIPFYIAITAAFFLIACEDL